MSDAAMMMYAVVGGAALLLGLYVFLNTRKSRKRRERIRRLEEFKKKSDKPKQNFPGRR